VALPAAGQQRLGQVVGTRPGGEALDVHHPEPARGGDGVGEVEVPVDQILAGQRSGRADPGDGVDGCHDPPAPGTPEVTRSRRPSQSSNTTPAAHCPHPPAAPGNNDACRSRIPVICSATKSSSRGGGRPSMNSCTTHAAPRGARPLASQAGAGQPRARAAVTRSLAPSSRSGSLARHFRTALDPSARLSRYAPSFQPPASRRSTCQRPPSSVLTARSISPTSPTTFSARTRTCRPAPNLPRNSRPCPKAPSTDDVARPSQTATRQAARDWPHPRSSVRMRHGRAGQPELAPDRGYSRAPA
jgi:hypothetical protein